MIVVLMVDVEDHYYNGQCLVDYAAVVVDQEITAMKVRLIGPTESALDEKEQRCLILSGESEKYREAGQRLGFTTAWLGFTPVMRKVSARILSAPRFEPVDDGRERISLRVAVDVAMYADAVSTTVADVHLLVVHSSMGRMIDSHVIEVEQVFTTSGEKLVHRLTGYAARDAVASNPVYMMAARVVLAMFLRLDDDVLTPSTADRSSVDSQTR